MPPQKQRLLAWAITLLIAGISFLAITLYRGRDQFVFNPALVQELQGAPLPPTNSAPPAMAEWPGWRGPLRDGVSRETGLLTDWPKDGLKAVWQAPAGVGYSSLAVAKGRLFTMQRQGDEEQVVCLDAGNGKPLWAYGYPIQYKNDYGGGPRSTPTVDGDRVYAVGALGVLTCIDVQTGKKDWDHDLLREFHAPVPGWGVACSPLVNGNLVFAMPGGSNGYSLVAFDKRDGKLVWHSGDDPAGYSSPILSTAAGVEQLLCFTGSALVSVNPKTGEELWRYPWNTDHQVNAATPLVRGDYVFISSGYAKGCALLKVGVVDGKLEPQLVFKSNRLRDHHSGSVLWGDHIYGFDEARLTCLDLRTGQVTWKESGFGQGTLLAADGHLFILGENGKLAVAEANPERLKEKASFKFSGQRCWTMPVIADGRLYLRDEEKIVCYDLRKTP